MKYKGMEFTSVWAFLYWCFIVPQIKLTGKSWNSWEHNGWGNSIQYDKETGWHGWTTPLVRKGDVILMRMTSGKILKAVISSIKYAGDPRDMWFAEVVPLGYVKNKIKEI